MQDEQWGEKVTLKGHGNKKHSRNVKLLDAALESAIAFIGTLLTTFTVDEAVPLDAVEVAALFGILVFLFGLRTRF